MKLYETLQRIYNDNEEYHEELERKRIEGKKINPYQRYDDKNNIIGPGAVLVNWLNEKYPNNNQSYDYAINNVYNKSDLDIRNLVKLKFEKELNNINGNINDEQLINIINNFNYNDNNIYYITLSSTILCYGAYLCSFMYSPEYTIRDNNGNIIKYLGIFYGYNEPYIIENGIVVTCDNELENAILENLKNNINLIIEKGNNYLEYNK